MKPFVMHLQSATAYERLADVTAFIGQDLSGRFGILPGHERVMTSLTFGLARFRTQDGEWEFLALPGGLLYFVANTLFINTRRYLRDRDYTAIARAIDDQLLVEEATLSQLKSSLHRLEEEMFTHLWKLSRKGERRR